MRAAVLGHPIAHTLSPILHRAAYDALGLTGWRYDAIDVDLPDLPRVVAALDTGWAGLSLTMPLKQGVIALLDDVSDLARSVGAVNTVVPAGQGRWRGENTDVAGIVAALTDAGAAAPRSGAILGAGATASSALAALAALGVHRVAVCVRSPQRAGELLQAADRIGVDVTLSPWPSDVSAAAWLLAADVVVATAPAHAADPVAALLHTLPAPGATAERTLLDVVYSPRPTALSTAWRAAGGSAVDGLAMLLHQAAHQVELMTGARAPLAAMRAALDSVAGPVAR